MRKGVDHCGENAHELGVAAAALNRLAHDLSPLMNSRDLALRDDDLKQCEDPDRDEDEYPDLNGDEREIGRFRLPDNPGFETELCAEAEHTGEEDSADSKVGAENSPRGHDDEREQQQRGDRDDHDIGEDSETHSADSRSTVDEHKYGSVDGEVSGTRVRMATSA